MSDRELQIAFIKKLALHENDSGLFDLQEKIAQAEKEEKTVRYTASLVALIGFISMWGLGYCAVFFDGFLESKDHFLIKFFSALGLGSVLALAVFSGFWLWHRSVVNRLYSDVRKLLLSLTETRFHSVRRQFVPVTVPIVDSPAERPTAGGSASEDGSGIARAA